MLKDKKIFIINMIALALIVAMDLVYILCTNVTKPVSVTIKTVTSALFVATGVVNYIYARKSGFEAKKYSEFALCMLIGLVFAMLGDVVLEFQFEIGAGLFALGHVMFLISYTRLNKINWKDLLIICGIIVIALLIIFFYDGFNFSTFDLVVVVVYAVIISCMLGKSAGNLFDKEQSNLAKWLIFVGSLCFFLSDLFLLFRIFAHLGRTFSILCLTFYYPAEWMLAVSVFYSSRKEIK